MIQDNLSKHLQQLYAMARSMVPQSVGIGVTDPRQSHLLTHPSEAAPMRRMVGSRQREYRAGRAAAQAAMAAAGLPAQPVLQGMDRAPIWPVATLGSLSHDRQNCIALVARSADVIALGVDLEPAQVLAKDLQPVVLLQAETDWLARQAEPQRGVLARLIFSAKECVYKCQYPLTRQVFGFDGLAILLDLESHRFSAQFTKTIGQFHRGYALQGRYRIKDGMILTTMILPATGINREKV